MCINQEISLNTFLFGVFSVGLAIGNKAISVLSGLYFMSFVTMQLVEFFAWRNITEKEILFILSLVGLFLIFVQPIIYIYAYMKPSKKRDRLLVLYLVFAAVSVFLIRPMYPAIQFTMSKAENGHLAWHWLNYPPWIVFGWFSFILYVMYTNQEFIKMILWTILIGTIYILYVKTGTWGSLWCWIANLFGLLLLYKVFYKSINT